MTGEPTYFWIRRKPSVLSSSATVALFVGSIMYSFQSTSLMILVLALSLGCGGCERSGSIETTAEAPSVDQVNASAIPEPVQKMQAAVQRGDWSTANQYVQQALIARPGDPELVIEAARVAAMNGDKRLAAELLVDAVKLLDYRPAERVNFAVQALIDVGELYEAIDVLEQSLERNPDNVQQRRMLVAFLGEAQRTDRIPPHFQKLIQSRSFDAYLLEALTEFSDARFSEKTDDRLLKRNPDDHRIRLSQAFRSMNRRDPAGALEILNEILERHPGFAPAHAMKGQALVALRRFEQLDGWLESAPANSKDFADYWLTLGDLALEGDDVAAAARAYWEASQRAANNSIAWSRLGKALRQLKRTGGPLAEQMTEEQIRDIEKRNAQLLELRQRYYDWVAEKKESQTYTTEVARSLFELGRNWEAEAWTALATTRTDDPAPDLQPLRQAVIEALQQDTSWISTVDQPALRVDLAAFPLPNFSGSRPIAADDRRSRSLAPSPETLRDLKMVEVADQWGLAGVGAGNNPADATLAPLIRSTGVGGGAIDYDLDGRADLVVMGAGGTMLEDDSQPNELCRNLGRHFAKVTEAAGVMDTGFGQGLAVGDFNEDGFPDLFFANLGVNRLFRNNGDGTFTDCSDQIQNHSSAQWTTCGAFFDFDQDHVTDLLTTNYCAATENMDRACPDENGVLGPCHPLRFSAHPDQFYRGTGDGSFAEKTSTWIPDTPPARGLGIVAGKLDGSNIAAYIANDMTANVYYSHSGDHSQPLVETAAARGLAVDAGTRAQASMGIASGDFDLDGDLDFYVTGFAREYNIFYEQVAPGLWDDQTNRLGLVEPTYMVVGFGTEAVDLDSDGIDELIVTNGHIGDFADPEVPPYAQPLQIFRRAADSRFELVDDDSWGNYFASNHVGRGLWTMDINRDGHNDVVVTHMSEQIGLLLNTSGSAGNTIGFRLVGDQVSRDAVGAIIRFEADGRERTLWRLAGDGYMCSNESVLRAGVGAAEEISNLTITWSDGTEQSLGTLPSNRQYVIVQGQSAFETDRYQ